MSRAGGARAMAALEGTAEERVGELAVSVRHSPVAESYGPSATGVCHPNRGVLEALAVATFGRRATVIGTACVAMGSPACRFVAS